ncbi:putative reverse transcriptase domain-containing protein [Tanacetum coccineum]
MPITRQGMTSDAIEELIPQRVADALATYEANRNTINGNGNGNGNGSGSHSNGGSGSRRTVHTARGCMYKELLNCQPFNFKVNYVTCTLLSGALTWWNSHVRNVGHDAVYDMSWKDLMKMTTEAYCPRNEIQKVESELWNLTGNVASARLVRLQDAVKLENNLMNQKVRAYTARQIKNKRRLENNPRDNHETAKYGKIWYDEDVLDLRSVETEFPAIVFNDSLTSNETPSYEPMVSFLNNNEIDFRISFDESDDEDYMVVFDKNSFSYKIISTNDLKTDSENDNEKVNKPLFPSPEPTVSCIDDLDFFKDFENEFPAIVYNDALTSKSDFSTEPTLCP